MSSQSGTSNSPLSPAASNIDATIDHQEAKIVPIVAIMSHIETETFHIAAETAHVHPFEPTALAYEKMAKSFCYFENLWI